MKITLRAPRANVLDHVLADARQTAPSLEPTGSFEDAPRGFRLGCTREIVGSGAADYEHAQKLVRAWAFLPSWARAYPEATPQDPDETVVLVVKTFGLWCVLPARIIQRVDEVGRSHRTGFVYSALPGHVAQGYERFLVEHDAETGQVTFELTAVARPAMPALRLARSLFSLTQRHFRRACMAQLRAAIQRETRSARVEAESS